MSNPFAGGDYNPRCQFNAKEGEWWVVEGSGESKSEEQLPEDGWKFVADFHNLEVGYVKYGNAGEAPEFQVGLFRDGKVAKPQDGGEWKDFQRVPIKLESKLGGGHYDLPVGSFALRGAIGGVYAEWAKKSNDEVAVIEVEGVEVSKTPKGTNKKPKLKFVGMAPRDKYNEGRDDVPVAEPEATADSPF